MTTNNRRVVSEERKSLGAQTLQLGPQDHITSCSAALRVVGPRADERRVSEILSLKPTVEWGRGELVPSATKNSPGKARGLWKLSTEGFASKSIEEHCQMLLEKLRGNEQEIAYLIRDQRARVTITILFYSGIGHGGFNLAAETVSELATFCEDVEVHFT